MPKDIHQEHTVCRRLENRSPAFILPVIVNIL